LKSEVAGDRLPLEGLQTEMGALGLNQGGHPSNQSDSDAVQVQPSLLSARQIVFPLPHGVGLLPHPVTVAGVRTSCPPSPYEVGEYYDHQYDPKGETQDPQQAQSPCMPVDIVLKDDNTSQNAFLIVRFFKSSSPVTMGLGKTFLFNKDAGEKVKFLTILWRGAVRTEDGFRLKQSASASQLCGTRYSEALRKLASQALYFC
jgi:hypothetical protein